MDHQWKNLTLMEGTNCVWGYQEVVTGPGFDDAALPCTQKSHIVMLHNRKWGWENMINRSPYLPIFPSLQFLSTRNCIAPHQFLPPYYQLVEPSVRAEQLVHFQDFTAQTCLLKISNLCQQSLYHQTICLNCFNCIKKTSESNCSLPKLLYPKKQRNRHPIHITLTA